MRSSVENIRRLRKGSEDSGPDEESQILAVYETICTLFEGKRHFPVKLEAAYQCTMCLCRSRDNPAKIVGNLAEVGRLKQEGKAVFLIE